MKKIFFFLFTVLLFLSCQSPQEKVDIISENGVEVVLNHIKPYRLADEPSTLTLKRIFSIDTEDDSTAAKGMTDISSFDVDPKGNIYILKPPTGPGKLIFKFSREGEFMASFGPMGQGPNEMEYPDSILAVGPNRVCVVESPKNKYHLFADDGTPLSEKSPGFGTGAIVPLENGSFLMPRIHTEDMTAKYLPIDMGLYDSEFRKLKELDRFMSRPNRQIVPFLPEKIVSGIEFVFLGKATSDRIYIGNSERDYEILVYDLEGQMIRKIRKEYSPVPVAEDYKKEYVKKYEEFMPDYAKKIYFPEHWHAFHSFFPDDGRLFVMTYEPGENPGEYMFDIFNQNGIFVGRKSLNILRGGYGELYAKARGGRLYCVQEKKSGYKEFIVFKMAWQE